MFRRSSSLTLSHIICVIMIISYEYSVERTVLRASGQIKLIFNLHFFNLDELEHLVGEY